MKIQLIKTPECEASIAEAKKIAQQQANLRFEINDFEKEMCHPNGRAKNGAKQKLEEMENQKEKGRDRLYFHADMVAEEINRQLRCGLKKHLNEVTAEFLKVHFDLAMAVRQRLMEHLDCEDDNKRITYPKVTIGDADFYVDAYFDIYANGLVIRIDDEPEGRYFIELRIDPIRGLQDRKLRDEYYNSIKTNYEDFTIEFPEGIGEFKKYNIEIGGGRMVSKDAIGLGVLISALGGFRNIMNEKSFASAFCEIDHRMLIDLRYPPCIHEAELEIKKQNEVQA